MPLWTDAYLADTRHLSDAEHGRYLLLLIDMWRAPNCRFPNDRQWLMRRFKRAAEDFDREIQPLLTEFCQCDGNWWTQKKLLKVWKQSQKYHTQQRDRAKSRWDKEKAHAAAMQTLQCNPSPKHYTNGRDSDVSESLPSESSESSTGVIGAPEEARHKTKKHTVKRRQLCPMPENWTPNVEFARSKGLTDAEINRQANKAIDYAKLHDKRYADWDAYWRNWVRNFLEMRDGARFH